MPFLIFFLVISLPVIEVASIVEVSRWIGGYATFLLLAAGIAFGAFLIRSQSMTMGRRVLEAVQAGTPPEQTMLDSGATIFAGLLFMIRGSSRISWRSCSWFPWRGARFGAAFPSGCAAAGPAPPRCAPGPDCRRSRTAPRMSSTWTSPKCRGIRITEAAAGATRPGGVLTLSYNVATLTLALRGQRTGGLSLEDTIKAFLWAGGTWVWFSTTSCVRASTSKPRRKQKPFSQQSALLFQMLFASC